MEGRIKGFIDGELARHFVYPLLARRRGWQGEVLLGFRVAPDGRIGSIRIARSSGHGILDSSAVAALGRVGIVPDAARWLAGRHFDMVLPVHYRLVDG